MTDAAAPPGQARKIVIWPRYDRESRSAPILVQPASVTLPKLFGGLILGGSTIRIRPRMGVEVLTPGRRWSIDNDSDNPNNWQLGYIKYVAVRDKEDGPLSFYGTSLRIQRLGDDNQQEVHTVSWQGQTNLPQTCFGDYTICPNGAPYGLNRNVSWVNLLRARTPPAPPTCVPFPGGYCYPSDMS